MKSPFIVVLSFTLAVVAQGGIPSSHQLRAQLEQQSPRMLEPASTVVGSCHPEYNYDYVGNDIASKPGKLEDCCALCSAQDGCRAFSWSKDGTCWLKRGRGTVVWNTNVVSAIVIPLKQPICWPPEADTDFVDNDIGSAPAGSANDCCAKCESFRNCRAFSFSGGTCWFKSTVNRRVVKTGVTSAEVFARANSDNCGLEQGVDYVGNDIGSASGVAKPEYCCDKCTNTPGCRAFSWTSMNGGTCWFKNWKGDTVANPNVVSAYVAAVPPSPICTLELDVDYVGNDIGNKPSPDAYGCCSICLKAVGCKAFSWSNYNGGTCWLKSDKINTIAKSGVKSSRMSW